MWKFIKIISALLSLAFWFSSFFVWMHYSSHRPIIYDPDGERMFPLDTHGSVVYITALEHYGLYGLMIAGIFFALVAGFAYVKAGRD